MVSLKSLDLLLKHLQDPTLGDVDQSYGDAERFGRFGAGSLLDHEHLEGSPRVRLDPLGDAKHGQIAQLAIKFVFELFYQIVTGFDPSKYGAPLGVAAHQSHPPLMFAESTPGMLGDRLQPGSETPRGVILEPTQLLRQDEKNILRHVLRIDLLQAPLAAPLVDSAAIPLDELTPRTLIHRLLPQSQQQADVSRTRWTKTHQRFTAAQANLAPILRFFAIFFNSVPRRIGSTSPPKK
jgi:hypothetical protein